MNIVFTICSLNYLGNAKCLYQSIKETNSNSKFVFIIADKIAGRVDESIFEDADYFEVEQLGIDNLEQLIGTYNIIEFNTAIKPFAFRFLHRQYAAEKIIYLDPDIMVFEELGILWTNLDSYDFIVTPHILNPIVDPEFYEHQKAAICFGIFNLGFLGVKYNSDSELIIDWWALHMRNHGHSRHGAGEFFDQKILNLLPVLSPSVLIEKGPGLNVAGWNVHERTISKEGGKYYVNGEPLVFYHYSGVPRDRNSKQISKYNDLTTADNKAHAELLNLYRDRLDQNNHWSMLSIKCLYELQPNIHRTTRAELLKFKIKRFVSFKG